MRQSHRRTPDRLPLAVLLLLFASWSCGGGTTSEPTVTPTPPAPKAVRVAIVALPKTTGSPWELGGPFSVRVEDAAGVGVPGVHVRFTSLSGKDGTALTPTDTTTTDSLGVATAWVKFGTKAGPDKVLATATGVSLSASVDLVITPGPPMFLRINQYDFELFAAGDSAVFQAYAVDGWENLTPDAPVSFAVSDPTLVSVTPSTLRTNWVVRALRSGGTATIKSAGVEYTPMLFARVYSRSRTACGGISTPQTVAIGAVVAVSDSVLCLAANPAGGEYQLMVYNESTDGGVSLGTTVTGYNLQPSLIPARIPTVTLPSLSRGTTLSSAGTQLRRSSVPKLDLRFHERLLERSRPLRRLFAAARAARPGARYGSRASMAVPKPSYSLGGTAAPVPAVDDYIALNVADSACTGADMRTFRVEAVGSKSIVLADTANPGLGFKRADYQRFAARFDTLVYPLDIDAFGAPSDIDGNGRVAILFTRAVNELTPPNSGAFVGGFFHPRDLFPRAQSPTLGVCETSNEGELVYMMVPDPAGVVNGNQFSRGMVDTLTTAVLAHELQHLVNASRRMYVNTAAQGFEETWLNEGLSHIAEELLYFRESGFRPRWRLTANSINDTWAHFVPWVADDAANFVRFYLYLLDPANHSPLDIGDDLETRGATWAFLRFAVDSSYSDDGGVWQRFGNSTTTGFGTLAFGLQRDPKSLLREFALANMRGGHPSWDYESVYREVFVDGKYPLPFGALQDGVAVPVAAKGSSASYYRFTAPAKTQTLLRFGSSGAPPDANLRFVLRHQY